VQPTAAHWRGRTCWSRHFEAFIRHPQPHAHFQARMAVWKALACLNMNPSQAYRWEDDENAIPEYVSRLLQMYVKHGIPKVWGE
jgi:hypothetical protein